MNKKIMTLALAVACAAMFALPAAASATQWHLTDGVGGFTLTGPAGFWESSAGTKIECTSTTGTGSFTTTTSGSIELLFHGCKNVGLGVSCNSAGQPAGTIKAGPLLFDTAMIVNGTTTGKPGILLTPNGSVATEVAGTKGTRIERVFSDFVCFGVPVKMIGNGLLGTITLPACNVTSKTATLSFKQSATTGQQEHILWTGEDYDLTISTAGGAHQTVATNLHATLAWNGGAEKGMHCT